MFAHVSNSLLPLKRALEPLVSNIGYFGNLMVKAYNPTEYIFANVVSDYMTEAGVAAVTPARVVSVLRGAGSLYLCYWALSPFVRAVYELRKFRSISSEYNKLEESTNKPPARRKGIQKKSISEPQHSYELAGRKSKEASALSQSLKSAYSALPNTKDQVLIAGLLALSLSGAPLIAATSTMFLQLRGLSCLSRVVIGCCFTSEADFLSSKFNYLKNIVTSSR